MSAILGSLLGDNKNSDFLPGEKSLTDLWHLLIIFILSLTFWVPVVSAFSSPESSSSQKFCSSFSRTPYKRSIGFFLYLFALSESLWLSWIALLYSFRSSSVLLFKLRIVGGVFYLFLTFWYRELRGVDFGNSGSTVA